MVNALEIAQAQAKAGTLTDESKKALYDQYKTNLATTGDKTTALSQTQSQLSGNSTPKTVYTPNTGYQADQVGIPGVNISPVLPKIETPKITPAPTGVVNGSTSTGTGTQNTSTIGKVETGMQTGTDVIGGSTSQGMGLKPDRSKFLPGPEGDALYNTALQSYENTFKQVTQNEADRKEAEKTAKKEFLAGKSKFDENKAYYTNYDEVNNLYTAVYDELTASMNNYGVIPDNRLSEIASKYNLTVDEVKNPDNILLRGNLSEEGKEKTGFNKLQSGIDDLETAKARKLADIERSLAQAQQNYDWQIEDVAKQLARNVGWTEAQGAWSGALRGSGYLQGIQNIKDDGQKTIDRLKILSERVKSASEEDLARVTQDYNNALSEAKKGLDTQLEDLKKNSILALSEAQATYGMGSDKLSLLLGKINDEYGLKSNQAISAYISNMKGLHDLMDMSIKTVEAINKNEADKIDARYNQYVDKANGGAILSNTSLNTIATDLQNGLISVDRAKDLQNIMTSSIQATLGALAPLTTQDLATINTLLNQGLTPAEVIATMRQDERFKQKVENKFGFQNVGGGVIAVTDPTTGKVSFESQTPTGGTSELNGLSKLAQQDNVQCGKAVNTYIQDITGTYGKMGDTLDSKLKALESIGISNEPVEGGVFVSNPLNNTIGHTGIVQRVNEDGSITVLEANREGKITGGPLVEHTYSAEQVKNMKFSQSVEGGRSGDYSLQEKAIMDTYLKNPASKQNITALQNAGLTSDDITNYKTSAKGYNTEDTIFDALFNFSGGASKVSEGEMSLMKDRAKTFADMGLTPQQAILKYKGLNVNENVDFEKVEPYITLGDNLSANVKPQGYESTISKYINNGDTKGLNDYINRLVDKEVQTTYKGESILSAEYNNGLKRGNELINLIKNNADKVGAFDGRVSNLIKKFKGTPDYQKIQTLLQMSQAEMRKYFAGSAVTETEMKALEDFIGGTTKMNSSNLITMIETLMSDRTNLYQEQRSGLLIGDGQTQTGTNSTNTYNITNNSSDDDIMNYLKSKQ